MDYLGFCRGYRSFLRILDINLQLDIWFASNFLSSVGFLFVLLFPFPHGRILASWRVQLYCLLCLCSLCSWCHRQDITGIKCFIKRREMTLLCSQQNPGISPCYKLCFARTQNKWFHLGTMVPSVTQASSEPRLRPVWCGEWRLLESPCCVWISGSDRARVEKV